MADEDWVEQWFARVNAPYDRWRRVLDWGPYDNEDTPDVYPDEMDAWRQEKKEAIYETLWSLPPDGPEAEKLRRIIDNAKPVKCDMRRRDQRARIANKMCNIFDRLPGESRAAKCRAYAAEKGVDVSAVEKFVQRARRVLGSSKQK